MSDGTHNLVGEPTDCPCPGACRSALPTGALFYALGSVLGRERHITRLEQDALELRMLREVWDLIFKGGQGPPLSPGALKMLIQRLPGDAPPEGL